MSHTAVHESRPSYCKKVHQRRTCSTHHSLTRKSILMITHNLVGYSIEFCNNTPWVTASTTRPSPISIANTATRIILWVPKYSHITISIRHELHWFTIRFGSEFEIRLFTQNCLVVIDPACLQKLRVGVFFNTDRRSLRVASQGYLARSRYECNSIRMAHLSCVGRIIENFMSQEVRQPTAMLNNSREGQKQITGKQNNSRETWKHAQ